MPPKRKAPTIQDEDQPPPTRRRTRSTAALPPIAPVDPPSVPTRRRGRPPKTATPSIPEVEVKPANKPPPNVRALQSRSKVPAVASVGDVSNSPEKAETREILRKPRATTGQNRNRHTVPQVADSDASQIKETAPAARAGTRRRGTDNPLDESNGADASPVVQPTKVTRSTKEHPKTPETEGASEGGLQKKLKGTEAKPSRRTRSARASAQDISDNAGSDDEILLSPKKDRLPARTPLRTNGRRYILDAVEITTPVDFPDSEDVPILAGSPTPNRNHRAIFSPLTPTRPSPATPPPPSRQKIGPPTCKPLRSTASRISDLPERLHPCLHAQKRAILESFRNPSIVEADEDDEISPNTTARQQLCDLLKGTISRGEGNSCLLIGPRGSGKTRIVNDALSTLPGKPIVVRLSGQVQHNDRLALREIARQVAQQTEQSFGAEAEGDLEDEPNPFTDDPLAPAPPAPSHLPTLISSLPSLARPTIIVMDSFDLFALHGRQALLYCLLDTAQSCRAGTGNKGISVVGVTTRVDTINLLEKRVKSRFSGRMLRTAGPRKMREWTVIAKEMLCTPLPNPDEEWTELWTSAVERFLDDRVVKEALSETFGIVRDVRMLSQILTGAVLSLSAAHPYPTSSFLSETVRLQRSLPAFSFLNSSSYPTMCLLIAANHERISGNDTVTFEMLYESFRTQLRTSLSAPVQVEGGSIGMVRCSREVLLATFEQLIETRIFVPATTTSSAASKQFLRCRCTVEREDVKKAIDANGQTNLKKWFSKAQ